MKNLRLKNNRFVGAKGFTLIELMVVVAIMAIMLSIAVPSFDNTISSNRMLTQKDHFMTAVSLGRASAIQLNKSVLMCKRSGTECSNGSSWSDGWIVFIDHDNDRVMDQGEVLRYYDELDNFDLQISNGVDALLFKTDGRIEAMNGQGDNNLVASNEFSSGVTFQLCSHTTDDSMNINLSALGRAQYTEGANSCANHG